MTCQVGISSGPLTVLAHTNYACGQLHVSVCVRFLLWSDFSFRAVFTHLLSARPPSHVWISVYTAHCCLFGLIPWCICSLSTCPRLSSPAEVLLRLQLLFTVAQTQEVTLIYVKSHDFLKQLVESLVPKGSGVIRQGRAGNKSVGFCLVLSVTFSVLHFCNSIYVCWFTWLECVTMSVLCSGKLW